MSLLEQVKASLKWKRSNREAAAKLGISIEKYVELKRQLYLQDVEEVYGTSEKPFNKIVEFKHDIDSGTAEIKAFSTTEPKTPEEIVELLKLDSAKWKLSSYWNKQRHDGWFISAMVTAVKATPENFLENTIKSFNPDYQPVGEIYLNENFNSDSAGVISIQDLHFGKENNEDIVDHFKEAIKSLVHRAYRSHKLDKIIYVIGGDLLNMDTFNGTTTSGTPVENCERAQDTYNSAFDALFWSVNYLKQFCENLHIVYLPGNHDRLSSYHMAHALSKCFSKEDFSIYFDVEYAERKVVVYGDNFFAFEHGDVSKKNTPLVYATEFPLSWGATKYRTCYTGHFHTKKTIEYTTENEYNGFAIKHLPSLCSTDYWHYHNKYTGSKRQAIMEIHDRVKGKTSEFIYTV